MLHSFHQRLVANGSIHCQGRYPWLIISGALELTSLPSVVDHAFWTSYLLCLFDAKGNQASPTQARNQLQFPKLTTHAVLDAWISGIGGFQVTIGT
ncbi:hypothetical protein DFS34DRAFT_155326 [Phlyctochytrium arcticum]|nr:hypothetical protein DFS34DRAFT_155326 [Phlyctochytrium arcticum]